MRVYWITPLDQALRLELVEPHDSSAFRQLGNGVPSQNASDFEVRRLKRPVQRKQELLCDLTAIGAQVSAPVVSGNAKRIFSSQLENDVDWIPLKFEHYDYWIMNILRFSDALDAAQSSIRRFAHGPIRDIETFAFDTSLSGAEWLFKVRVKPYYVLGTDFFRDTVLSEGLSGFHFQPVWDSEHAPFKFAPSAEYLKSRPDVFGPDGFVTNYQELWPDDWKKERK